MTNHKCKKSKIFFISIMVIVILFSLSLLRFTGKFVWAQTSEPIVITELNESIMDRMERQITLKVRDMNIVDVIKFLAEKGQFNTVISPTVEGRVTVFLDAVTIKDALDIIIISNRIAYKVQGGNIVQVMSAAEFEAIYGKRFSDKTQVEIIRLKYSKPSYVLAALDSIKSNVGKLIIDEDTGSVVMIDTEEAIEKMKEAIVEIEKPLKTVIYALQYAHADIIADKLRARIDAKAVGSIASDERSNKLIVRVFPGRLKEVENLIRELDAPTKEVMVSARILQVVFKPEYDFGIDWQLDFRDSPDRQIQKLSFKNFPMGVLNNTIAGSDNLFANSAQFAVGNFDQDAFEASIRAFESVSDTKILSNPQILIVNNEEAKIHVGDTVPYIISTTSGTGDNAITSEDVRFVDVGLKLNVIPRINDDGFITMRLRPEISQVVGTVSSQGGGIPQVNKTEVETTVMVKDGHTIVMGGLKKEDKFHTRRGIPGLMHIPWVGHLFGKTSDNFSQTEIVIFITPRIVKGDDDYNKMKGTIKPFKTYSAN